MNLSNLHQTRNDTSFNRYPEVFLASKRLSDELTSPPTILSFGCSTGEECFSLQSLYFPDSRIMGVDFNNENLMIARQKNTSAKIAFCHITSNDLVVEGPYTIIFCMSVLCRWPKTQGKQDISSLYPFTTFDNSVIELDKLLQVDGQLVIYNANYRFSDAMAYKNYEVVNDPSVTESGFVTKFNKDGTPTLNQEYTNVIFRKIK